MERKRVQNILLCGLGGQGIVFMARVMAEAAIRQGKMVRGAETHGMAQRGGSVVGHLRIGETESSVIRQGSATHLLSLDEVEAYRNINYLGECSSMYVNTASPEFPRKELRPFLMGQRTAAIGFDALSLALGQGLPQSTNLAMLGFFIGCEGEVLGYDSTRAAIRDLSKERVREKNLKVFDLAYDMAKGI